MRIPLPKMLRHWRERQFQQRLVPAADRFGLGIWAFLAKTPALYRVFTTLAAKVLRVLGGRRGRLSRLPLAGGWTRIRDLPAPEGKTFMRMWSERALREGKESPP